MNCCTKIRDLGCIRFCDNVSTGINAPATGIYTIVLENGNFYSRTTNTTIGSEIIFTNYLNEDGVTTFRVKNSSGTVISHADGSDCLRVRVSPGVDTSFDQATGI